MAQILSELAGIGQKFEQSMDILPWEGVFKREDDPFVLINGPYCEL